MIIIASDVTILCLLFVWDTRCNMALHLVHHHPSESSSFLVFLVLLKTLPWAPPTSTFFQHQHHQRLDHHPHQQHFQAKATATKLTSCSETWRRRFKSNRGNARNTAQALSTKRYQGQNTQRVESCLQNTFILPTEEENTVNGIRRQTRDSSYFGKVVQQLTNRSSSFPN